MKKNVLRILASIGLLLLFCQPSFALTANKVSAVPVNITVYVNDLAMKFGAYNIDGSSFFKLRDLAYALNGTAKQFEVIWDTAANAICLTSGQAYTAIGGEMTGKSAGVQIAEPIFLNILVDGQKEQLTAYNIGGNNYIKLRDMGQALDFAIEWDSINNVIHIDCGRPYTSASFTNNADLTYAEVNAEMYFCDGATDTIIYSFDLPQEIVEKYEKAGAEDLASILLPYITSQPPATNASGYAEEVARLVNIERAKYNLPALVINARLAAAAQQRAQELLVKYDHLRPDGRNAFSILDEYGVTYSQCAENIAIGYSSPGIVVQLWMNSASHRANILGEFSQIGVGVVRTEDKDGGYAWAQFFI